MAITVVLDITDVCINMNIDGMTVSVRTVRCHIICMMHMKVKRE